MGLFDRLFRSTKKPASDKGGFRTIRLPGASVRVPPRYADSRDKEDTTILEIPGSDDPTIRITLLFVEAKEGAAPADMARHVQNQAREEGREAKESFDGKMVDSYEEKSQENGADLIIRYWLVGEENCMAIFSLTMLAEGMNSSTTQSVLADMPAIVESFELAHRSEILETPAGPVFTTVTSDPVPPPQTTRPFSNADRAKLENHLAAAERMRVRYITPGSEPLSLVDLDVIFARWLQDDARDKPSADLTAEALGAAFGELVCKKLGMHWDVTSDEYGTAWSLGMPGSTIKAFPLESVRKRIETRSTEFFIPLFQTIQVHAKNEDYKTAKQ